MSETEYAPCRLCHDTSHKIFTGPLLKREVGYYLCPCCGYLQTEEPTWLDEAYSAPINATDTGIMQRNIQNTRRIGAFSLLTGYKNPKIVDFAGGYGILVRLLRDMGYEASWFDKYCQNLFARGFEYRPTEHTDFVTAFEAFEHFVAPMEEIDKMLDMSSTILFSTTLLPTPIPQPQNWWYYGEEHGQHIGFYQEKTFQFIAERKGLHFYTNHQDFHVLSKEKLSLNMKHLRILSRLWPLYRLFNRKTLTYTDHMQIKEGL